MEEDGIKDIFITCGLLLTYFSVNNFPSFAPPPARDVSSSICVKL